MGVKKGVKKELKVRLHGYSYSSSITVSWKGWGNFLYVDGSTFCQGEVSKNAFAYAFGNMFEEIAWNIHLFLYDVSQRGIVQSIIHIVRITCWFKGILNRNVDNVIITNITFLLLYSMKSMKSQIIEINGAQ